MKNPVTEDSGTEALILSKDFHIQFLNDNGVRAWHGFLYGDKVEVAEDSLYAKMFPQAEKNAYEHFPREGHVWIYQDIVTWDPIGTIQDEGNGFSIHTKVVLADGKDIREFAEYFSGIIPNKFNKKSILNDLTDEGYPEDARESGYQMFPGVAEFESDAETVIEKLFKNEKESIYSVFLKVGYKGKPKPKDFLEFLLEDDVSELTQEEKENKIQLYDALSSGLGDAFADAVAWGYKQELIKAFTDVEFSHSKVLFNDKDDNSWEVYVHLGNIIDYYIESCINERGELKFTHVGGDAGFDYFTEVDGKVQIPEEYPYPDEINAYYAYENFRDLAHSMIDSKGLLP